ncbi:MAG: glycosyltransferase [Nitrospirota bacterium]|nr:glycosyltransferase [Nitrospirota bacterium]
MKQMFPESRFAHHWLNGLVGLEIGPSTHNPFGLNTRNVGLGGEGYTEEQLALTGAVAPIAVLAEAGAIPLPSESEEFILASHVIEHCPDLIKTFLEWYRIVKCDGYLFIVVPHRDAAPSDRGKPLTDWAHVVHDYMIHANQDSEPEAKNFLYCHYHVFSPDSMKDFVSRIFGKRMTLVGEQDPDDKVGNGFVLVYQKQIPLHKAFPWSFRGGDDIVNVSRPADFYQKTQKEAMAPPLKRRNSKLDQPDNRHISLLNKPEGPNGDGEEILVTAIVPTYNSERFMRGVLEDLVNQTIAHRMEIIVVETGSDTQEIDIIRDFQDRYPNIVYLRTSQRMNATAATNLGVRIARGKFITPAPTDDRLRHDALEVMAHELEEYPEVGTVYADVFMTQFDNQTFSGFIRGGYSIRFDFNPDMMLTGYHMGPLSMWRKSVHETVGFFDETLLCASDYEFHCRVARQYPMRHIPQFLGLYLQNPKGTVNANPEVSQAEFRAIIHANRTYFPVPIQKPLTILQYEKPVFPGKYVNIGMVTFNRLDFTKAAITALLQYTCFPHVITVVDNGSTDGTPEYLQALHQQGFITHLILLPENVGIAKASNLAWSQAPDAEYYLKLDNDIVIQKPGWLSNMVDVIDRIPELGAIAYSFEPVNYPVREIRGLPIRPKDGNLNGACTLIPKRTHQTLGFWCEDYGLYGEEDADYGLRIQLQGLQNAYMEDEQVGLHLPAGRAAHIDAHTFMATDGIEEKTHAEYRAFKDESRRKNVQDIAKKNWQDYKTGVKTLYCSSFFVKEFHKDLEPLDRSVVAPRQRFQAEEMPREVSLERTRDFSREDIRQISVIVSDNICGRIRLLQPLLAGEGIWGKGTVVVDAKILLGDTAIPPMGVGQVWVIQRTCMLSEKVLKEAQRQGTRIVFDCDDLLWKIPVDNPNHRVITPERLEVMFRLMAMADCVTVSTEPIQTHLQKRGIAAAVLPNFLVRQEWERWKPQRRSGSRPRIGWAGQATVHKADTAILETIIEALKDEVEWVFLGEAPRSALSPGVFSETFSMVDLADYPKKLASLNLDLALAPLVPNEFNEAKSDIRILQYGILGYPVIGTDIFPHQQAPILRLPHEPQAWIKAIRDRIHDADALEREGEQLRQWVLAHRLPEHVLPKYERAWLGRDPVQDARTTHTRQQDPSSSVNSPNIQERSSFDCSIIIPVFNKVELTRQCLTHLAEVTDGYSYEVIVVDNASTDGTKEFLSTLGGDIQVISNPGNYGFAKACNQGAAAAKGRFLIFLNNDTIPKSGWLRPLVDEVQQHSDVSIVGSKLLYPDDTIQHAGVVFSKNCLTPYHVFRGASGDLPAVNVRQEFQVVTAACMLIRREEFGEVGGFDEIYRNGFEDVDLCLKVGKRGKKVIYQPESVLYHLEHQTPGRKDPEAERHNGRVLMDRWASTIMVDEDLYTVPAGYANRYYFRDGWLRQSLEPFQSDVERTQWKRVQRVQEILLNQRFDLDKISNSPKEAELRALFSEYREWPGDGEVLKWAAKLCQSLQIMDAEPAFWKRVLSLGEDRDARERLATLALRMNELAVATQHVQALLRNHPNDASGHLLQGILLMQSQEFVEAAKSFRLALQYGSDSRKAGLGLGMACMGMADLHEAWRVFDQIVKDHPDDSDAMNGLIQSGTALEQWEDLGQRLARYVERNPADCDRRFALAGIEFRAGRLDSAKHQFDMLSLLKPDFEGLHDLGFLLRTASVDRHAMAT